MSAAEHLRAQPAACARFFERVRNSLECDAFLCVCNVRGVSACRASLARQRLCSPAWQQWRLPLQVTHAIPTRLLPTTATHDPSPNKPAANFTLAGNRDTSPTNKHASAPSGFGARVLRPT